MYGMCMRVLTVKSKDKQKDNVTSHSDSVGVCNSVNIFGIRIHQTAIAICVPYFRN